MPTIRTLRQRPGAPLTQVRMRSPLQIGHATITSVGALPQATVRVFNSGTDVVVARDVSDAVSGYSLSVPDSQAYYAVGFQDGTWDSTAITWDNTGVTFDRTQSVGGVTANTLRGTA